MPRRAEAAALCLLLSACGEKAPPPPAKERAAAGAPAPAPKPEPSAQAAPEESPASRESDAAAEILRRYYDLIEARRYADAHALRDGGDADLAAFAAHFDRFASQKVTIGVPSEPVASGEWLYVEVPVQTYGTMRGGKPFGSAGTVTLRRRNDVGGWRIYTK